MLPLAAAGFHVVAPDQRGYGRTTGWSADYDGDLAPFRLLNLVRDVLGLVAALGHRSVAAVVGHDFGSPVAAWCALVRPDVFRSVALMSAPFAGPPALPFGTAGAAPQPGTGPAAPSIHDELAKLDRPRKHYQWYYSTRQADAEMRHCPQGGPCLPARLLSPQERGLAGQPALPAGLLDRRRTGADAHLLHHGSAPGHGRDRGGRDALCRPDRGLPVADRARAWRLWRRIRPDRLPGRAAMVPLPDGGPVQRRTADLLRPDHRRALDLHRGGERLGRASGARQPRPHAECRLHADAGLPPVAGGRALGAAGAAGGGERVAAGIPAAAGFCRMTRAVPHYAQGFDVRALVPVGRSC
ncbi:alpha/beta fold hydrolase [Siccirubricoccus sp. G192]|uniref:alpha/beta fold hydrolase n=1 Tax=Siccirubricoccus sp. G192 TaxID=2849651 RepID=UPI0035C7D2E7